ncbi:E3 ubiquitin-protein ligase TRIM71-like [Dysidea avara]|uniref:E3 ubiquitin-protein ligase TRIM71-like n=1 Tax=Dysidea avara TaxID=196820 RepID=UPI0033322278
MTDKEEMIQNVTEELKCVDTGEENIKNELEKIDNHYSDEERRLAEHLAEQRDAIKQQYCDAAKQEQLTVRRDELKSVLETIKSTSTADQMEQVTKQYNKAIKRPIEADSVEFVPIKKKSLPWLGKVLSNAPPSPTESKIDCNPLTHFSLGKTNEVTIFVKDSAGYPCKGGNHISAKLMSCTNEDTRVEISDNNDGICIASFAATQAGMAKLLVFIDGQEIKGSPCSIIVSSKDYQKFSHTEKNVQLERNGYGRLSGVAFSSRDKRWAVADEANNCVYVYFGSDHFQTLKCEKVMPKSIAFDDNNDLYVVGSLQDGHYIHKFNTTTGEHLGSFGKYGNGDSQLQYPHGVAVHNGKVYVADCGNKRIVVFTCDGLYYNCIGGQYTGIFYSPSDVAVNSEENVLLVTDTKKSCIVAFTLEGLYKDHRIDKKSFDTKKRPPNAGKISPQNIAIDADGLILVTGVGGSVHVFDCIGNYISCFDCSTYSDGIAVSRNGSIYVSSRKSIQVWS